MQQGLIAPSIDEFYQLSRLTLVKDEKHFDKFDQAFGAYFKGIQHITDFGLDVPMEWLKKQMQRDLSARGKSPH